MLKNDQIYLKILRFTSQDFKNMFSHSWTFFKTSLKKSSWAASISFCSFYIIHYMLHFSEPRECFILFFRCSRYYENRTFWKILYISKNSYKNKSSADFTWSILEYLDLNRCVQRNNFPFVAVSSLLMSWRLSTFWFSSDIMS